LKLHKSIVESIIEGLREIFELGLFADQVVKNKLKSDKRWGARDRKFIAESIYDLVRYYRWYMTIGEIEQTNEHRFQKIAAIYFLEKKLDFPEWFQPILPTEEKMEENRAVFGKEVKYVASIPDWLDEIGKEELGEIWSAEMNALNQQAKVVLRVNTLKTNKTLLIKILEKENVEVEELEGFPDALMLKKRRDLSQLKAYADGLFEIQDASSQLVAPFAQASSGMLAVDACAGAGGKTLHLAAQMENNGKIISLDLEEHKLKELRKRSKRANCKISRAHLIFADTIDQFKDQADLLLIDAPCSGLGVLRRKPDSKWKLTPERLNELKQIQQKLLEDYPPMLKSGGTLVYVTCSILPSENEKQVEQFLAKNTGKYTLEEERKIMPSEGFDGFYMARLRKLQV
jgi:16S rRNA (cytosine967-C5)-methyltransferase